MIPDSIVVLALAALAVVLVPYALSRLDHEDDRVLWDELAERDREPNPWMGQGRRR